MEVEKSDLNSLHGVPGILEELFSARSLDYIL